MVLCRKDIKYTEGNKVDHDHFSSVPAGKWHGIDCSLMAQMASEETALSALTRAWVFSKSIAVL